MADSGPIARRSLHDELADRLRDLIVEGELAAGERISEKALCSRFGVSRTPLREALKVLAHEGLVELSPNRGASVATLTRADVEEIFPILSALEGLAGELAAPALTDAELAEVRALHYQMEVHFRRGERPAYFKLNQRIHERLMELAHNATLLEMHRSLTLRMRRARYVANMSRERWQQAMDEHEQILHALEARDGPRAGALLRGHLATKARTVLELLDAGQDLQAAG